MKKIELKSLYRFDEELEAYYIDIQLENYRDAYSDWDYSALNNRDLNDDLMKYLLECIYELKTKNKIIIAFHILHQIRDDSRENRTKEGIYNYFNYKIRQIKNQRLRLIRDTFYFLLIGTIFLLLGTFISHFTGEAIIINLISEGFLIGGWVMIWEMFSIWFFNIKELSSIIKIYVHLMKVPIIFKYSD
ncbi:MAG: hypothetical protein ACERKZ_18700 [Lachnotalea sp.]